MAIKLRNVHISGAHTGIKSDGPIEIDAENVTFDNVKVPYDIAGAKSASIRGTRITNDPKTKQTRASTGWTKPNGPPLPVFCGSCKSIFPSRNYNFGGAYFNSWDNEETCPECRFEHAKLSEGLFDLADSAVRVLSAPDITYAMLQAISAIGEAVCEGAINPDEAVKRFQLISPVVGHLASRALAHGKAAVFLIGALAGIVALYYQHEQVQLAKEQVRLQRESSESSDRALERALEALSNLRFKSEGVYEKAPAKSAEEPSAGPPHDTTLAEKITPERLDQGAPKQSKIPDERRQSRHGGKISN